MNQQQACDRVTKGAAHLDQVTPGWASRIDTGTLCLGSCSCCVAGQLVENYFHFADLGLNAITARTMGFNIDLHDGENMMTEFQMLQDAWIKAIADRLVPTSDEGTPDPARFTPVDEGTAIGSALHSSSAGSPR